MIDYQLEELKIVVFKEATKCVSVSKSGNYGKN